MTIVDRQFSSKCLSSHKKVVVQVCKCRDRSHKAPSSQRKRSAPPASIAHLKSRQIVDRQFEGNAFDLTVNRESAHG